MKKVHVQPCFQDIQASLSEVAILAVYDNIIPSLKLTRYLCLNGISAWIFYVVTLRPATFAKFIPFAELGEPLRTFATQLVAVGWDHRNNQNL